MERLNPFNKATIGGVTRSEYKIKEGTLLTIASPTNLVIGTSKVIFRFEEFKDPADLFKIKDIMQGAVRKNLTEMPEKNLEMQAYAADNLSRYDITIVGVPSYKNDELIGMVVDLISAALK